MTKEEIKQFVTFLKKNNVYSAYRHNIRTPNFNNDIDGTFAKKVNNFDKTCSCLIIHSFNWGKTMEGHTYWHHFYLSWIKVRQGIKKL